MTNSRLSPQQAAVELQKRRAARSGMLPFVEYTTLRWKAGWIHREICAALDSMVAGESDRLIILCPPQHGKSTIISKRLSAYILGRDPTQEIISVSATETLATEFGSEVRDCVRSPEYRNLFPKTTLKEDSRAKGRWQTDQGGGYYAVGIGGTIFGRGGMAIIDDPFGSWEDAQSETSRKKVWDWYTGSLYNRIHPGKPIIVIQHRMHEQDLVGHLLEAEKRGGDKWRVVKLPAHLANPPWPEKYDAAALERIRVNSDERKWSALYMQDPTPEDGDYFKAEWWREYDSAPSGLNVYISGDFAVTPDGGDFTELAVWGIDHLGNVFALDWFSGQVSSDVWTARLISMMARWKPTEFIGEGGPIRRAVEPFLKRSMDDQRVYTVLEWMTGGGDKGANARSFQALMACGRVYWPRTDWAHAVKSQLLKFPGGAHDDKVDACSLFGRRIDMVWDAQRPTTPAAVPNWDQPMQIKDLFRKRA